MARVVVHYQNGTDKTFTNCGTSVYQFNLYIWKRGKRKGERPIAVIPLRDLHSKKKTGKKAFDIYKF